jgi:hypothetical protein
MNNWVKNKETITKYTYEAEPEALIMALG